MRTFDTGSTRDTDNGKADYSWRHPAVEQEQAFYMMKHSTRPDGSKRPFTNWWAGIPFNEGLKSLIRHANDLQAIYHGLFVYKERISIKGEEFEYTHYYQKELKVLPKNWSRTTIRDAIGGCRFNSDVCHLANINKKL